MNTRTRKNPLPLKASNKKAPKWIEALEARIAPAVTVINVDSLALDLDGDGFADPGDRIHYQVTIQNTGSNAITGMSFQDIINDPNLTLVPGSINVSPLAIDDSFNAVGNTTLRVGGSAGPGPEVYVAGGSVIANDVEFLSDTFVLTPISNGVTTLGGTVTLSADGTFVYIGPAGVSGVTDTFTYTINDDGIDGIAGTPDDLSSTGTVSIALTGKVWYIDNTAPAGGNGTSAAPFNSLSSVSGGAGPDAVFDTFYVAGGGGNYTGGITLLNGQTLLGANEALTAILPAGTPSGLVTLKGPGAAPTIANAGGNGVTLANGNTLRGFTVGDTLVDIAGTNFGSLSISNVTLNGTGSALNLTNGELTGTFNSISTSSATSFGIKLSNVTGSLNTGTSTFNGLSDNSNAVEISGSALNVSLGIFTVGAIGGTTGRALLSTNHTGSFTVTGGSVTGVSGNDFEISGGTGTISIAANITNTSGRSISIDNHDSGDVTFSGTINDTGTGLSITNSNGTGLDFAFSGGTKTFNTGANQAITLTNNANSTFTFSSGLAITTSTGTAFNASNSGTINIEGSNNTINVGGGSGLLLSNTNIGSGNLNFRSISVGTTGMTFGVGISLDNTGTAGGLIVTGDGFTAGSGGTIRFKSGGDGSVSGGIGIYLNNTSNVSLTRMQLNDFQNFAILGNNVTGFSLTNSVINGISGTNDSIDEAAISFSNLKGNASISNTTISGGIEDLVRIVNSNTGLNRVTFDTVTFGPMSTVTGNDALFVQGSSNASVNVTVRNSIFQSARGDHFHHDLMDTATGDVVFQNNQLSNNLTPVTGGGGISLIGGGSAAANTTLTYSLTGNTITGARGDAILVALQTGRGSATGTIDSNTIGNSAANGSGSSEASGIEVRTVGRGAHTVTINNNQIHQYSNFGVYLNFGDMSVNGTTGTVGAQNITVTNNTIGTPSAFVFNKNAVQVNLGTVTGDSYVATVDIRNNNGSTGGSTDTGAGSDYVLRQRMLTTMKLPGYTGAVDNNAAVVAFIQGQNNGAETVFASNTVATGGGGFTNSPLLFMPVAPQAPVDSEPTGPGTPSDPGSSEQPPISGEPPVVDHPVTNPPIVTPAGSTLTQAELDAIVAAAIARWEAAGISTEQKALLDSITFSIGDLPGWYLGQANTGHITLDIDAAGNGWFVDSTPLDDSEFANANGVLTANSNGGANGRLDVLTTVMHEFGHALGLDDLYASSDTGDLMYGYLHLGERRVAAAGQAEGAVPHEHGGMDFLFTSMSLGSASLPVGKSITIVYDQTVNSTINASQATSQIRFDYTGAPAGGVLSDDPSIIGASNPTVTQLDKPDVTVAISGASSVIENSGNTITYTFTRQGPTTDAWTANFSATGTALNNDYSIGTQPGVSFDSGTGLGSVTFAAGQSTAAVVVTVTGDNTVEANETAILNVTPGTNYDVGTTASATGTVVNDDAATVSIAGGTVTEGDSGTANLPFTITLSNPVDVDTTVQFSTANGTAVASGDYVAQSLVTVTIPAGATSVTHNVIVNGDNVVELNETVTGTIGNLSASGRNATLDSTPASGTIANDDTTMISVGGGSVFESNSGTANLPFTITLTKPVDIDTTVQFSTANGTAVASGDYVPQSLVTVTIPAGSTSVTHNVVVNGDSALEADETLSGSISNVSSSGRNVTLGTAVTTGTIQNDDSEITLSVSPGSVMEDGTQTLVYTFTRTGYLGTPIVVGFNVGGTATFNTDYTASGATTFNATAGTISFGINSTSASITVDPTADTDNESDETVSLTLVAGTGYSIGTASDVTGTITDDDTRVSIVVAPGSIGENSGSSLFYTFTRTGDTSLPLTVNFTYAGNATLGSDYNQTGAATFANGIGTIIIPVGAASVQLALDVLNDKIVEGDETAVLTIATGSGYGIGAQNSATGAIDDNDFATIALGNPFGIATTEEGFHEVSAILSIIADGVSGPLSGGTLGRDITVNVQDLLTGTATSGSDYAFSTPQTITFASGEAASTKSVPVTLVNDERVEGEETIRFQLNNLVDGTGGQVSFVGPLEQTLFVGDNDTATISLANLLSAVGEAGGTHNVGVTLVITANGVVGAGTLDRNVSVNLQDLLTGSASNEGGDYSLAALTTLTFASGESGSTKSVAITVGNDTRVEGNETINLQLNGLNDGTGGKVILVGSREHTVTVNDNDFATISLANGTTTAGEGAASHNVSVALTITANGVTGSGTLDRNVTVNLADLLTGSATASGDYNLAALSTLTFASGEGSSTKSVSVGLVNDARVEGNETINLQLGGLNDGTSGQVSLTGSPAHTVTITDNDFATISLAPQSGIVNENAGSQNLGVVLTITADGTGVGTLDRAVSVSLLDLIAGNATSGSDFVFAFPQTVTFGVGTSSSTQNVTVGITDDTRVEGDESFALGFDELTDGTNGQVTFGTAVMQQLTIVDNDTATISFSQGSSTAGEGAGTHNVGVTLVITANGVVGFGTLERNITVALGDLLTGSASASGDYTFTAPQTITFASGAESSTQNAVIGVANDARVEGNETINFSLGTLGDSTGGQVSLGSTVTHTATIVDNDTATISLASAVSSVGEGAGTHNVGVTLVINADGTGPATLERNVTVNLQDLLTGTASPNEGGDYNFATPVTLTFASGEGASTKNATISLNNDTRVEGNETINLQINGLNDGTSGQVSLTGSPAHTVTISDNDFATISLASSAATIGESAGSHNVGVVLTITANGVAGSGTLERDVTVNLADLLTGTAIPGGSDYNLAGLSTLTFASGEGSSTKNVSVGLVDDTRVEGFETINLQLDGLNDGTAGQVSLTGSPAHAVTITDNDFATVSLGAPVGFVNENIGSQDIAVVLTITANGVQGTGTLDRAVSVNLADLLAGTATSGSDYTFASPQTVSFGVGSSSNTQNVAVTITDDTRVEGSETFSLQLNTLTDGSGGQVTLGNLTAQQVIIADNDTATISFTNGSSTVGEPGGNHNVGVTLVVTANGVVGAGTLERPVSVTVTDLLTGTAAAAGDYNLGTPQTVTFESGESSSTKNVVVGVVDDNSSEGSETINLQLGLASDPTEGRISLAPPTGHIVTIVDNDIDLVVTKTESAPTVVAGSGSNNLIYTITVTNAGLTDATGVVLGENLTLVPGVSISSITPSAGVFELTATPDGVWTIGNLAAGGTATLTVVLTVGSSTAQGTDIISDTATITASNENRVNVGNDSATESTSVQRLVDLSLTKTDGLVTTTPGSVLSYMLNVSNTQPSDANGVVLTETLPLGTTFNAAASSSGWVESSPGVYTFSVGTVAGNSSAAAITFAVTVNSIAPAGLDNITNTASLADDGSAGGDSTPLNNSASDMDLLEAAPDLKITKTASSPTAVRGGLLSYTLTYSNVGTQDATGIIIEDILPANATFVPGGSTLGWIETVPGSGTYHFDIASLGAGETFTVTYQVRVNESLPAGTTSIVNTASITDDGHNGAEAMPADNQSTVNTLLYQGIYAFSLGFKDNGGRVKGGTPPMVKVYDIATGELALDFLAYEASAKNGVRVAVGDLNGDGFDDIITSYAGGNGRVRAFDGVTGEQMSIGGQMELAVRGGNSRNVVFVASGDVTGDGRDDIIVSEAKSGSRVKVFDGVTGELAADFKPFGARKGGVRVAIGDLNGDGVADIIAGQQSGGSRVRVFEGGDLPSTGTPDLLVNTSLGKGNGVFVSAGDVTGDGVNELIIGSGEGTKAKVAVFSPGSDSILYAVKVFNKSKYGVRVAAADVDLDGIAEIIASPGAKGGGEVWFLNGDDGSQITSRDMTPFPDNAKAGIHVAGTYPIPTVRVS